MHDVRALQQGRSFSLSSVQSIAGGGSLTFVGIPDGDAVVFENISVEVDSGPVLVQLVESPTITVPGTQTFAKNRRRDSTNVHRMKIYGGATVTGGEVLQSVELYATSTGVVAVPADGILAGHWILNAAKTYAVRITNNTSPASLINISVDFTFTEGLVTEIPSLWR